MKHKKKVTTIGKNDVIVGGIKLKAKKTKWKSPSGDTLFMIKRGKHRYLLSKRGKIFATNPISLMELRQMLLDYFGEEGITQLIESGEELDFSGIDIIDDTPTMTQTMPSGESVLLRSPQGFGVQKAYVSQREPMIRNINRSTLWELTSEFETNWKPLGWKIIDRGVNFQNEASYEDNKGHRIVLFPSGTYWQSENPAKYAKIDSRIATQANMWYFKLSKA